MKAILIVILFFSANSWAGLQIQRCSNESNPIPIRLCLQWPNLAGKLNIGGEIVRFQFTESIEATKASFVLPSNGHSGVIEFFRTEAILQINSEAPIQLTCSIITPGSCY